MTLSVATLHLVMSSNNTNNLAPSGSSGVTASTTSTFVVSSSSAAVMSSSVVSVAGPSRPDTSVPVSSATPPVSRLAGRLIPGHLNNYDRETFMDLYDWGDVRRLEGWVETNRDTRGVRGYMVVRAPISDAFASFLLQLYERPWESRLLAGQGEVLLFQLRSYILGYSRLTTYQRGQFRRLWPAWTNEERRSQLEKLASLGGFVELE